MFAQTNWKSVQNISKFFVFVKWSKTVIISYFVSSAFWIDPLQTDIELDVASAVKEIEALQLEAKIQHHIVVIKNVGRNKGQKNMEKRTWT